MSIFSRTKTKLNRSVNNILFRVRNDNTDEFFDIAYPQAPCAAILGYSHKDLNGFIVRNKERAALIKEKHTVVQMKLLPSSGVLNTKDFLEWNEYFAKESPYAPLFIPPERSISDGSWMKEGYNIKFWEYSFGVTYNLFMTYRQAWEQPLLLKRWKSFLEMDFVKKDGVRGKNACLILAHSFNEQGVKDEIHHTGWNFSYLTPSSIHNFINGNIPKVEDKDKYKNSSSRPHFYSGFLAFCDKWDKSDKAGQFDNYLAKKFPDLAKKDPWGGMRVNINMKQAYEILMEIANKEKE